MTFRTGLVRRLNAATTRVPPARLERNPEHRIAPIFTDRAALPFPETSSTSTLAVHDPIPLPHGVH